MKRIKLLAVRSTIASQGRDSLDLAMYSPKNSGRPRLFPAEMIAARPELARFAVVEPDAAYYPEGDDRPDAGVVVWRPLATRINELLGQPDVDGVVLTHGTNVLEETAYFLNLTVKSDKPVVLVGAQRPWTALSTDGHLNLVNAVRVAADDRARGQGVLVVLNDEINAARDVAKTNTYRVQTFRSQDFGVLGYVDVDRVEWYRSVVRKHTYQTEFDLSAVSAFPRVDILYSYSGEDGGLVEASRALGAQGIVIAGTGAGDVGNMREALEAAIQAGVAVVRSNRVGSGRVYAPANAHFPGSIAADTLNPQKARVLLLLALTRTQDPAAIQRMFEVY